MEAKGPMTEFERYELRRKFIEGLTQEEWEIISEALFDVQCKDREWCRDNNCGDREWTYVDKVYGLYLDICTFVIGK